MLGEAYLAIVGFFEQGGNVLYLIAITTFLMWILLFERMWYFAREHRPMVRGVIEHWLNRDERSSWTADVVREKLLSEATERIRGSMPVILTCVTLCPLLGLLGTVTGMISVFDAMASQGGNARSMAAGVSMATIPTMSGMIASLSGIMGSTFIRTRIDFEVSLLEENLTKQ